jgi:uncharacterized phage infection (PIP) family protein YhgE
MNDLLFYTLLIAIVYYSLVYLPSQKSHSSSPRPTFKPSSTQTEPIITGPEAIPDPTVIKNLQSQIATLTQNQAQQTKTIQQLETKKKQEAEQSAKQITALKQQITQLTQTQQQQEKELGQTLDTLIKGINDLSKELD